MISVAHFLLMWLGASVLVALFLGWIIHGGRL